MKRILKRNAKSGRRMASCAFRTRIAWLVAAFVALSLVAGVALGYGPTCSKSWSAHLNGATEHGESTIGDITGDK